MDGHMDVLLLRPLAGAGVGAVDWETGRVGLVTSKMGADIRQVVEVRDGLGFDICAVGSGICLARLLDGKMGFDICDKDICGADFCC